MGQNVSSLEYDNCQDPCANTGVVFRDMIMLQHLIIHFPLHHLSNGRLQEVKNRGKFQTFISEEASKGGRAAYER